MAVSYVSWLKDSDKTQIALVGGKGANLGELVIHNFPVPNGFCVTTNAYRNFLKETDLDGRIANVLSEVDLDDFDHLMNQCKNIQEWIRSAAILSEIYEEIETAYGMLNQPPVAVRSSATAEDLPEASFAGQQESYLNVVGLSNLIDSVQRCWGSLWTPRAVQYRAKLGINNSTVGMSVVIQKMIPSDVSGVLFTINPLDGRTDRLVINASYGLGETVVSGSVTPDLFVLDKKSMKILEKKTGGKEEMITTQSGGGILNQEVPNDKKTALSLSENELAALGHIGKEIEELFGAPQDIEWAVYQGQIFILQARPITAQQKVGIKYGKAQQFLLAFLLDYFPIPLCHFDRSVLLGLVGITFDLMKPFGLRTPSPDEVIKLEEDGSLRLNPVLPKFTWQTLLGVFTGSLQALRSLTVDPSIWLRKQWPIIAGKAEALQKVDVHELADTELLELIANSIAVRDKEIFEARFDYIVGGWITMISLPPLLKIVCGSNAEDMHYRLLSSLDLPTASINREMRKLGILAASSDYVRDLLVKDISLKTWSQLESTIEGQAFLTALRSFLNRFGGRTGMLISIPGVPAWEDEPAVLLSLIGAFLRNPSSLEKDPADLLKRESEEAYISVLQQSSRFLFGERILRFFIHRVQSMVIERDWIIYAYELVTRPMRRGMYELGDRLVKKGILIDRSDVRHLSLAESSKALTDPISAESLEQIRLKVKQRKLAIPTTRANWKNIPALNPVNKKGDELLNGIPASPGNASGKARILLSESDFSKLNPGEILVCRASNPSWTPLFAIAAAVVADNGGSLSHAAIVAREYGIPAVLGTQIATTTLVDGVMYTVDGTKGVVTRSM